MTLGRSHCNNNSCSSSSAAGSCDQQSYCGPRIGNSFQVSWWTITWNKTHSTAIPCYLLQIGRTDFWWHSSLTTWDWIFVAWWNCCEMHSRRSSEEYLQISYRQILTRNWLDVKIPILPSWVMSCEFQNASLDYNSIRETTLVHSSKLMRLHSDIPMARSPAAKSTTTDCGFNYQLIQLWYWSTPNE